MKKTILLASLVAVASMAAGTTGSVEFFNKNEHEIKSTTDHAFKVKEVGVKTKVKVKDTGLSFGGTFQGKDIVLPLTKYTSKLNSVDKSGINKEVEGQKYLIDTFFNNSSVFVKYDLPEMNKVNSYVKATLNPKVEDRNMGLSEKEKQLSFKAGNVELEGDVNYTFAEDAKIGVNSKTVFPFKGEENNYGAGVVSTHKLYLDAKKLNSFKDNKASIELQHSYDKDSSKAVKYVGLNAETTYAGIDKLDLTGKFNFRYQFNGDSKVKDLLTGDDVTLLLKDYMHSYELDAKYLMMNDKLELTGGAFVQHIYHNALALKADNLLKGIDIEDSLLTEELKPLLENAKAEIAEYKKASKKLEEEKAKLDNEVTIKKAKKDLEDAKYDLSKKVEAVKEIALKNEKAKALYLKIMGELKGLNKVNELVKKYENEFNEVEAELKKDEANKKAIEALEKAGKEFGDKEQALNDAYTAIEASKADYKAAKEAKAKALAKVKTKAGAKADEVEKYLNEIEKVKGSIDVLKSEFDKLGLAMAPQHQVNYGLKLGVKYTGIENLTLKANGVFGASTYRGLLPIQNYTLGYVKLGVGAKYDYKVSDKFTVSPEFNTTVKFSEIQSNLFKSELVLAPKVSAKYTPIEKLNISGEVEVPIKWSGDQTQFGFNNATIKTGLNIKYEW